MLQLQTLRLKQNGTSEELADIDREVSRLSEQNSIYTKLFAQGALDEVTYYGQTDKLKNQITELRSRRMKLLSSDKRDVSIEELRKLEKRLSERDFLLQFDEELFDEIVGKVLMEQNGTVTFAMKCGLELNVALEEL